ncbi:hypothetical protein BDB01DRAFT_805612 [Pilobolus umbonatus]|nr:hypothetical protein BDB01DRAFT_805612 [Pilobolus umbonatus]
MYSPFASSTTKVNFDFFLSTSNLSASNFPFLLSISFFLCLSSILSTAIFILSTSHFTPLLLFHPFQFVFTVGGFNCDILTVGLSIFDLAPSTTCTTSSSSFIVDAWSVVTWILTS